MSAKQPATGVNSSQGSLWNRWEPHIHPPGTILNNQYKGDDVLENFIKSIEEASPVIKSLGITDYFILELYDQILQEKQKGRLPQVDLIFPNVELRLGIETSKGSPINCHLLISPEDPEHINEAKRFLSRLTFSIDREDYHCNVDDLIRLGKKHDKKIVDRRKALEAGANQFKVDFGQLIKEIQNSSWAIQNILLAVSGNTTDGTAGLAEDDSFKEQRVEIERRAHIIFSANPKQRDFWIGKGAATLERLTERWNGRKPCLHGCDAHDIESIGKPAHDRYCWIKGDITFESLKQACLEPEERSFIGPISPRAGISSKIVNQVSLKQASWLKTSEIPLNPGLVAIIGARGSGKTALADFIAAGGYALSSQLNDGSFIKRAAPLIKDEQVSLLWASGDKTENELKHIDLEDLLDYPKIQYLSQQFVEDLCSAEGLTDKLMGEIERVIFQAHGLEERVGATSFNELLDIRSENSRNLRLINEEALRSISEEINREYELSDSLAQLKQTRNETNSAIENDKKARQGLIGKGQEERQKEHTNISQALDVVRRNLDSANKRALSLTKLQTNVLNFEKQIFPAQLKKLKDDHAEAGLSEEQWKDFSIVFKGNTTEILTKAIEAAKFKVDQIKGKVISQIEDKTKSLLIAGVGLEQQSFNALTAELERLQSLIGIDKENASKFSLIGEKIVKNETALTKQDNEIKLAESAPQRIKEKIASRRDIYKEIFEAIIDEERELNLLYEPLMLNLKQQSGTLGKLSFYVHRSVDLEAWAEAGEQLLDLRKAGDFRGTGALVAAAKEFLKEAWEKGTADEVTKQMDAFREKHTKTLLSHGKVAKTARVEYRNWITSLSEWLYSTGHISVSYGIKYDGLNITQLSPGTRGIVLLLLYLAIDKEDDRPLIIDQPEENLDPKSIFDELVPIFRTAKQRRQIIIITHNANLVVNTDADQVIIATCNEHKANELPPIHYASGGIENPEIRGKICEILEGGEAAFRERAKRLRVNLLQ